MNVLNWKFNFDSNRANVFRPIETYEDENNIYYVFVKTGVAATKDDEGLVITDDVTAAITAFEDYLMKLLDEGFVCFNYKHNSLYNVNIVATVGGGSIFTSNSDISLDVHNGELVYVISVEKGIS